MYQNRVSIIGFVGNDAPPSQKIRCRQFVRSRRFEREFPSVSPDALVQTVNRFTRPRKGGVVGDLTVSLENGAGELTEFYGESFFNQHYSLTLLHHARPGGMLRRGPS